MATQHGKAASGQSITAHPMFPALVALWSGSLLGLGSLAVRPSLLEQVVLDLGIDTVIPAAAPPLGTTFRILLALAMAGLGMMIGLIVARRLRRAPAPAASPRRARDAHPDAPPRRPISAHEEFDDGDAVADQHTGPQPLPGRRRALAMAEDNRVSDFHEYAPLPGGGAYAFDATARLDALVEKLGPSEGPDEQPLELEAEVEAQPLETDSLEEPTAGGAFSPPDDAPHENNDDLPFGRPAALAEPPFARPVAELADEFEPEPEQIFSAPRPFAAPAEFQDVADQDAPVAASAAERLAGRPLEQLSTAELSERLAIALEQRRQRQAAGAAARQAAAVAPAPELAAVQPEVPREPEPEPLATLAAPAIPAALRPLDLGFEDEADEQVADALPQRTFSLGAVPRATPAEPAVPTEAAGAEEDELDDEALADGYSSLLDLSRPAPLRSEFVRVDDEADDGAAIEPVVTFPGQAARRAAATAAPDEPSAPAHCTPSSTAAGTTLRRFDAPASGGIPAQPASLGSVPALDREEADRALRAALATLQRMSGAA